jgi:hypothetical protein
MMRIISIRWQSVARILAIIYAVFGLGIFFLFAFTDAPYLTLPFGILGPLFHLNLNVNLARSSDLLSNAFYGFAGIVAYALTGWITGAAIALCFNVIAKAMGGIDAKFLSIINEKEPTKIEA